MTDVKNGKQDWRDVMPHYRLFDDALMMACFDDAATVQEVLRIILGRTFTVTKVTVQEKVPPSQWHGAVFDVTALDENGNKCDIEIQREDTGDLVKRAEFYSCVLGRMALNTGEDYAVLRETYVIFITETDVFKRKLPVYRIERRFEDNMEVFGGGSHILFVNGDYTGNDEVGWLVYDMKQADPDKIHNKVLSDRVRMLKETVEEGSKVSELTKKVYDMGREEGRNTGREEGRSMGREEGREEGITQGVSQTRASTARAMLADNMDASLVARYTSLSLEEVKALEEEK